MDLCTALGHSLAGCSNYCAQHWDIHWQAAAITVHSTGTFTSRLQQLLCTNPSTINHTLTNLQQLYHILEVIKRSNNCFIQLCTPR